MRLSLEARTRIDIVTRMFSIILVRNVKFKTFYLVMSQNFSYFVCKFSRDKMKQRDTAIDITKAIGILLMILGHCSIIPDMPYKRFIYTFHMPLFFIISGYFFKSKGIKESLKYDTKHLMTPYFTTSIAVVLLTFILSLHSGQFRPVLYYVAAMFIGSGFPHPCLYLSHLPSIGAIWFFPALLVCKNVYNSLSVYSLRKRLLYSCAIYVVATLIGRYIIFLPFSVLCGLSAIIFFAIGDYYKLEKPKITWVHCLIGILCWGISFQFSEVNLVEPRTDLYFIDIIGATTATFLVYKMSEKINDLFRYSDILPWIGRNSMYILCFHLIDLNIGISSKITQDIHPIAPIISMLIIPLICTWIYVYSKKQIA